MIEPSADIKADLIDAGFEVAEVDYNQRGYHLEVGLNVDQVRDFAKRMFEYGFYLVFLTAIHVEPEKQTNAETSGLVVVYQFAAYDRLCRVKGQVSLPADGTVSSICDIYQGANWHERETRDMYGVIFSGHPNLTPLLLTEADLNFHPLKKDEKKLKSMAAVSWQPAAEDNAAAEPKTSAE